MKDLVVYVNKCDLVDSEVQELVEMEIRELLTDFGFKGSDCPVIFGSAMKALEGDTSDIGMGSIRRLTDALDEAIPLPVRDTKSPFMIPIDSACSISGRGTVVVGTIKVFFFIGF